VLIVAAIAAVAAVGGVVIGILVASRLARWAARDEEADDD
jgi:hypothetical protein